MLVPRVLSILCAETPSCAFQLLLPKTPWREAASELDSLSKTASNQARFMFVLRYSEECKAHAATLAYAAWHPQAEILQQYALARWSEDRQ